MALGKLVPSLSAHRRRELSTDKSTRCLAEVILSIVSGEQRGRVRVFFEHGGELFRGFDAELFVDVHAAEHHFDVGLADTKMRSQKAHHVVGGATAHRGGGDADLELLAIGLADGVFAGAGFTEYVDCDKGTGL